MSFKQEIETWVKAIGQYDNHEFEEALKTFDEIAETAKILFNCGVIHATLGQHHMAVECYQKAIKRDNYLAIAYFQQGVSNFLLGDFEEALANFNDTLIYLRGNRFINYDQLGLKYKLYSCAVLFNRGLCYVYLHQKEIGMRDLGYAAKEKETEEHDVIDEAIQEEAEAFTVFSIGVGTLYRPSSAKVKNLKSKDYLGRARLIASAEHGNVYTASADPKKAALAAAAERAHDDRAPEMISYGASNLIRTDLRSRSRQHSEPPVNRNVFPPTPPPESEHMKPAYMMHGGSPTSPPAMHNRSHSQASQPLRPEPLNLTKSSFTNLSKESGPRIGTIRTASEPRGPASRRMNGESQPRRLFMEAIPARPHSGGEADIAVYPDELLAMDPSLRKQPSQSSSSPTESSPSNAQPSSRPRRRSQSRQRREHPSIEEEDETIGDSSGSPSSVDGFDMLHNAGGGLSRPLITAPRAQSRPRPRSSSIRGSSRTRSQRLVEADVKDVRVKVHYDDDTRYMMLPPEGPFEAFVEKVSRKFTLKGSVKIKTKDEGDLITMGDQDDWDLAVGAAKREMLAELKREEATGRGGESNAGLAKMEVWVHDTMI